MTAKPPRLPVLLLALPLLLAHGAVGAMIDAIDKAPNCALSAPPPDAGVDTGMGQLLKIYPRNPDIGPSYAGCQTLWAEDGDGWSTVTIVHYAAGHVAWIESPQETHDPMAECRVEDGKVVRSDPALCAGLDELRFESLPAACLREAASVPASANGACERR
jgi:hypothetical protein